VSTGEESKLPTVAQLQKYIREKTTLDIFCSDAKGTKYIGTLKWFDEISFCVKLEDASELTIQRSAVLAYRVKKAK
jgi:hypothetical protein